MDIQDNTLANEYKYDDLRENKYEYEYEYEDFCNNTNDNSEEYIDIYNNIRGNSDNEIKAKETLLYLINLLSKKVLKYNRFRFVAELLLYETNIQIFKCISNKFDPNFYVHDYLDKNFRTPDLDFYLNNRTKIYNNEQFDKQVHIDFDLKWLYDNIEKLRRWKNNVDELDQDIKFSSPPYLKSIINNLKILCNYYLKRIEKENNKIKKRVVITFK